MRGAPKLESTRSDIRKRRQVLEVYVEEVYKS
jgi:hypothetical protein